jgi:integrase/recombinase XerD
MCDFMLCDSVTTHETQKNMKQAKLLTELDFKRLTAIIDSLRHSTRNHTAVALSFYAGLRAIEISAVRIGDVFDP